MVSYSIAKFTKDHKLTKTLPPEQHWLITEAEVAYDRLVIIGNYVKLESLPDPLKVLIVCVLLFLPLLILICLSCIADSEKPKIEKKRQESKVRFVVRSPNFNKSKTEVKKESKEEILKKLKSYDRSPRKIEMGVRQPNVRKSVPTYMKSNVSHSRIISYKPSD